MVTTGHASGRSPLSYPTAGPGSARTSDHDFLDDLTRALVDVDRDGHCAAVAIDRRLDADACQCESILAVARTDIRGGPLDRGVGVQITRDETGRSKAGSRHVTFQQLVS